MGVGPIQQPQSSVHYLQHKQHPANAAGRRVAQYTSALEAISLQATAAGHAGSANTEVPIPYAYAMRVICLLISSLLTFHSVLLVDFDWHIITYL